MNIIGIPYRRLSIESSMSPHEFEARLQAITTPGGFRFRSPGKQFRFMGKVSVNKFQLLPNISGRNAYVPWILGSVAPSPRGTRIDIVQTLHPLAVLMFLALFSWIEYIVISRSGEFSTTVLLGAIVFHLVMYFVGFLPQATRTKERIRELAGTQSVPADW